MQTAELSFDNHYLYVNGKKFFSEIRKPDQGNSNVVWISLPVHSQADLLWDQEVEIAASAYLEGKWIFWALDFGFEKTPVFIHDTSLFYSLGIAIEEFSKRVLSSFQDRTLGVCIFEGDVDFGRYFVWTQQHQEYFEEKKLEYPANIDEEDCRRLFAADIFSDYLQRLCSFLPESVLPFALIDALQLEDRPSFLSLLLSKERFQHLLLGIKQSKVFLGHLTWKEGGWIANPDSGQEEVRIGICLPREERILSRLNGCDDVFHALCRSKLLYRVIPESKLNECWDGIDDLIVWTDLLSDQGKRKIHGFQAAGGRVISVGPLLNLENEISWEDYMNLLA